MHKAATPGDGLFHRMFGVGVSAGNSLPARKLMAAVLLSAIATVLGVFAVAQVQAADGAMTSVTLTSDSPGTLTVSWNTASPAPTDYRIRWAPVGSGHLSWKDDNETDRGNAYPAADATSLTVSGLSEGAEYKVQARARYHKGEHKNSPWSGPWDELQARVMSQPSEDSLTAAPVTETPVTETPVTETPVTETPATETRGSDTPSTSAPATPNLLGAAVTPEGHVMLVWMNPADASITGYQVLRGPDADSLVIIEEDTGSSGTSYTDTSPPAGQTHTYAVKARNAVGLSPLSNTITATVPAAEEELITASHTAVGSILVSNLEQTAPGVGQTVDSAAPSAQRFTTGDHPRGYHLTEAQLYLKASSGNPEPVVTVRGDDGGLPSETVLATLNSPPGIFTDPTYRLYTFTASDSDTLEPSTPYWLHVTSTSSYELDIKLTLSDDEDSDSELGWLINDERHYRDDSSWNSSSFSLLIAIRGHEAPPVLVSNLGQPDGSAAASVFENYKSAQAFVAGPGLVGYGYRFQGIRVSAQPTTVFGTTRVPVVHVSLHSDDSGHPGSRLHTLTVPDGFASTAGYRDYTLSAPPGTVLRAGARYWVIFEVTDQTLLLRSTSSTAEDQTPPPVSGWRIGNWLAIYSAENPFWENVPNPIKLAVLGWPERVTDEPDGVDFPGADFNAHETFGVVTPGTASNGHLTPGLDRNNGQTGDYWYLDTRPGGSYRVEVKFGNSSGNDTGGSAGIEFLDPDGVDYASGCCESDHNRDDGHTFVHFTHSRQSRERNTSYLLHVAAYDQLNSDSRIYNGPYTITMADITGTDMVASNLYLGETNNLLTTVSASRIYGVPFTTGTAGGGYELDRIYAHIINNYGNPRLSLYRGTAEFLCDFRNPSQVQHHVDWSSGPPAVPFLAPDCAGRRLAPSTTYRIVFEGNSYDVLTTDADNEITDGSGWTIGNEAFTMTTGGWSELAATIPVEIWAREIYNPLSVSLEVTSDPTRGMDSDTYGAGDAIAFEVKFSEAVTITGAPQLRFSIEGDRYAPYVSGSGTDTLVFSYTVLATDIDASGIFLYNHPLSYPDAAVDTIVAVDDNLPVIDNITDKIITLSGHKIDGTITD